jgi:hypothetical protein
MFSEVITEQELVVSGVFRAIGATDRRAHKLRIALVKGRVFQNKQYIGFNPELQIAHWQENPRGLFRAVIDFFEASRKRLFLLVGGYLSSCRRLLESRFSGGFSCQPGVPGFLPCAFA